MHAEIRRHNLRKCAEINVYIWEHADWPEFSWREKALAKLLAVAHREQGRLLGKMETLGFDLRAETMLKTLTEDVVKSSDIEGEKLDADQVRSSIARRLGMDIAGLPAAAQNIEGVVEMMLDATGQYDRPLTEDRLFGWHAALFPTGRSGIRVITVGDWRDDCDGPMRVVSGPAGREKVHYQAPPAARLADEMKQFFTWFEQPNEMDPLLFSGLAHFWFVSIHPFDDGNGRIARAIADMALARSEESQQRFYSMSAQIRIERKMYYDTIESTQRDGLDITHWLEWFIACLVRAIEESQSNLDVVLQKTRFWERYAADPFNQRQTKVLNRLLDGFEGKLTTSKWAKIASCSQDTAYRDILELIERGALKKDPGGGRSTSYSLAPE